MEWIVIPLSIIIGLIICPELRGDFGKGWLFSDDDKEEDDDDDKEEDDDDDNEDLNEDKRI